MNITPIQEIDFDFLRSQSELLAYSYHTLLGSELTPKAAIEDMAEKLYNADFVVLSHDGAEDPCFNYANKKAQELFEFDWNEFQGMPSRLSAEPDLREEREKMLEIATKQGYFTGYKGVRISKSGKRFYIDQCTIFNLIDEEGKKIGQAATFSEWQYF